MDGGGGGCFPRPPCRLSNLRELPAEARAHEQACILVPEQLVWLPTTIFVSVVCKNLVNDRIRASSRAIIIFRVNKHPS